MLATTAFFALSCMAHAGEFERKWNSWIELGGYGGSDGSARGETVIFHPFLQTDTTLLFADIRGKFFSEDAQEGNLAFGYRRMLNSGWNAGIWSGLDIRRTENDNVFYQAALGLEFLSDRYDVRVNGYVPLNADPQVASSSATVALSGSSIFMTGGQEMPLYGVDAEVGMKLAGFQIDPGSNRLHELRLYGGGFWFSSDDAAEDITGPSARLEYRIENISSILPGSRLTVESEFSYDDVREERWEVGARFRIPFGGSDGELSPLTAQERRMADGLERDTDIVIGSSGKEMVADATTDVVFESVVQTDATSNLQTTANNAGSDVLIIVDGSAGDYSSGADVQEDQTWQGGASSIMVRGLESGVTASFTAPGSRPTVNNSTFSTIELEDNSHIAGFNINAVNAATNWTALTVGNNGSNRAATNNTISTLADSATGISLGNGNSDIYISGNSVTLAGDSIGISMSGTNTGIVIDNNRINAPNGNGIFIGIFDNDVRITNNVVSNSGDAFGLRIDGDGTRAHIANNRFEGAFGTDVIVLNETNGLGNILSGSGNIFDGTLGGVFCNVSGTHTGSIGFGGSVGNCPP